MEEAMSDDCSDSEFKIMKDQLDEYGLGDENLSKEEMSNLLKALKDSKTTATEDDLLRQKDDDIPSVGEKVMKRRWIAVKDRRLPWSLLPADITPAQKARTLAVYIKVMAINRYRQARQAVKFAAWPPAIQILEESSTRIQPCRSTRSGRIVPLYTYFDDDSSDMDFVIAKTKKKRVLENDDVVEGGGVYSNKELSLKRKPVRVTSDNTIESKLISDFSNCEPSTSGSRKIIKGDEDCN